MSWRQSKSKAAHLVAALLLTAGASAAAANVLVVRSSGPSAGSYPAGRSLPDNARINLRSGDTLVVLDARGTRTFRGPGTFSPATAAQAGQRTVDAGGRRARVGAVRSAGIVPSSPSTIWQVDVSQSGTMCVADPANLMLWRADAGPASNVAIAGPNGERRLEWPAGRATLAWPSDLPIADGAQYRISQQGVAVPSSVRFETLEREPSDMTSVAEALIRNGCQDQLDLLIESAPSQ